MRVHLRLYGDVQGVGFRVFALRAARSLKLAGYVRNCADGSVEVEAEGAPADLASFRETMEAGPAYAAVRGVEEIEPGEALLVEPFEIRR